MERECAYCGPTHDHGRRFCHHPGCDCPGRVLAGAIRKMIDGEAPKDQA